jgi:hypothetical protein
MTMPRWLYGAAGIIAIVAGLYTFRDGLFELFPALAADRDVASASAKATKAADDFAVLTKDAYLSGNVPRESDSATGPLLDAVFGVDLLKSKATLLAKADLKSLSEWLAAQAKVGSLYIFAGTGIADPTHPALDATSQQKISQNTAKYAPEIGRYMDGELAVVGAMLAASGIDATTTGSGLDNIRQGLANTLFGLITTFPTEGITDDWRRDRLAAINALAPKAAKVLQPDQCKQLIETAHNVGQSMTDSAVQSGLKAFGDALKC